MASPTSTDEYKVELEVFEGPLDLLHYLIKKNDVEAYRALIKKLGIRK